MQKRRNVVEQHIVGEGKIRPPADGEREHAYSDLRRAGPMQTTIELAVACDCPAVVEKSNASGGVSSICGECGGWWTPPAVERVRRGGRAA